MKRFYLFLSILFLTIFMSSCSNDASNPSPEEGYSKLIIKAETKSANEPTEEIIFTGDDILWFNGTTKEIRFKDNYYQQNSISLYANIKFYLDDEYLFSTLTRVSDVNSQIFNSPVFYYSIIENKFFINDGYPDIAVLGSLTEIQKIRDENMQVIANEWDKFIGYMKKVNKYKE